VQAPVCTSTIGNTIVEYRGLDRKYVNTMKPTRQKETPPKKKGIASLLNKKNPDSWLTVLLRMIAEISAFG